MITFKAIIIPGNRRQDGTFPVKIRVTFKGVSRRLPTTMVCKAQDLTRGNKIKNADILQKAEELIARMRSVCRDISPFDLEDKDVDWVVVRIKKGLSGKEFHLDFFEWADSFLKSKRESSRKVYYTSINALERYLGRRELDINDITKALLLDFCDFASTEKKAYYNSKLGKVVQSDKAKKPGYSTARYLSMLKHIHDAAKKRYNDDDADVIAIPRSPFSSIEIKTPPAEGQRNLGRELMQPLISFRTEDKSLRRAIDTLVVSFGLMGANMADLYRAGAVESTWIYNRTKTQHRRADKAEMRVDIPEQLHPFIARLQEGNPRWLLPALHRYKSANYCTKAVNEALASWCKGNCVQPFTFYAARHTWATLARSIGIEKATIDDCLAHKGDFNVADIYAEKSWDLINEANRKVLALFEWPTE